MLAAATIALAPSAHADPPAFPIPDGTEVARIVGLGLAALIAPSETGVLVTSDGPRFVLGWSWQVPVTGSFRHLVVGGLSWVPDGSDHHVEGRLGYRFAPNRLFGGLGIAGFDHAGPTWSPEIGVKIARWGNDNPATAVHLLARAEISPELNQNPQRHRPPRLDDPMRRRRATGMGSMLTAAAIALAPASARADFNFPGTEVGEFVKAELLLPSETGAQVTSDGGRFVLGWSWQVPLGSDRHRVVAGVNLVPEGGPHDVGLRLGYRYADRNVLGGVGMAHDGAGFTWSLELGVRGKPLSFGSPRCWSHTCWCGARSRRRSPTSAAAVCSSGGRSESEAPPAARVTRRRHRRQ